MTDLQPAVWFGILFAPPHLITADRPALPEWARDLLSESYGEVGLDSVLADKGYEGDWLIWLLCPSSGEDYWGMAIGASVQRAENGIGTVNTSMSEEVTERWGRSLARALMYLDVRSMVATSNWYQTA